MSCTCISPRATLNMVGPNVRTGASSIGLTARCARSKQPIQRLNQRRLNAFSAPRDRPFRVLGIESSADDSCCAIVTSDRQILTSQVVKQHHINAKYGGIHPLRAQEGHAAGVVGPLRLADHSRLLS